MSDEVYHKVSDLSTDELLDVILDTILFSQKHTGHKVAKRLGVSPQALDHHIQQRKKEVLNNE